VKKTKKREANYLPTILPTPWKTVSNYDSVFETGFGLRVVVSDSVEDDGKTWLHVSVSRPNQIPDYSDLCEIKRIFIGSERKAVQVFPPESEHFNLHPYCLHLWAPIDHDPFPDFRDEF